MARNTIKCNLTGEERITNNSYLAKKASRIGVTVDRFRELYISKAAAGNLAVNVGENGLAETASQLSASGKQVTPEMIYDYLSVNGKNKLVLNKVVSEYKSIVDSTSKIDTGIISSNTTAASKFVPVGEPATTQS